VNAPTKRRRVLPADVYDFLELSAEAFGGIGCGSFTRNGRPCCIYGHAGMNAPNLGDRTELSPVRSVLFRARILAWESDDAVRAVSDRTPGRPRRVTFAEWCEELGVVRGE
jgi:hypothetical protein